MQKATHYQVFKKNCSTVKLRCHGLVKPSTMDNKLHPNWQNEQELQDELKAISPLLAKLAKPAVPAPADSYFSSLAGAVLPQANQPAVQPQRVVKLWHYATASLATAASIAVIVFFGLNTTTPTPQPLGWDTVTNEELVQYALEDADLLETQMFQDDKFITLLVSNEAFQYLAPANENEEYNNLLLEMIDDETLMEDWL